MKTRSSIILLFSLCGMLMVSIGSHAESLSENSIFHLNGQWHDQNNQPLKLEDMGNKIQVLSLIYTHCLHTCPTIVSTMQMLEAKLTEQQRHKVQFVLVSLTPDTDTPEAMKEFANNRKLDANSWTLLSGNQQQVRRLAMALDVKYALVEDNEVNHSNLINVLNHQGELHSQHIGVMNNVEPMLKEVQRLLPNN